MSSEDRRWSSNFKGRFRIVAATVLALLAMAQQGLAPATASVVNTCRKTVTVARNSAASTVTVTVALYDPACVDPPFAGEFVSLKIAPGMYETDFVTDGVTDQNGVATITGYPHSATDVIDARVCATHPNLPAGQNYYCEYGTT